MTFQEIFDLPLNIRKFYLEMIIEELKATQEEKKELIKAWKKFGTVPPIHLAQR